MKGPHIQEVIPDAASEETYLASSGAHSPHRGAGTGTSKDADDGLMSEKHQGQQDPLRDLEDRGFKSKRGELGEEAYVSDEAYEQARRGKESRSRLSWPKMAVLLCVEAIALGALSLPAAFAALGMAAGVIVTVGVGFISIYTGWICGELFNKFENLQTYADAGRQLFLPLGPRWGQFGYELLGTWLVLLLVFNYASHTLTGTLMFQSVTGHYEVCSLAWVAISAIVLFLLALPPTFNDMAFLGYIDFISIMAAIITVMIGTGIAASQEPGGIAAVEWSVLPPPDTDFVAAFSAVSQVVFAYSFVVVIFSFQSEMYRPKDVQKSVWAVGLVQIVIYTCTGAIIYAFVGNDVESPSLFSAPGVLSRVSLGLAIPVIFISGSINGSVVARYIHGRIFAHSRHKYINTGPSWLVWISILTAMSIVAFVIAEAIPFFSDLLTLISALFISGFSFYVPGLFWLCLLKEGSVFSSRYNLLHTLLSIGCVLFGLVVLVAGLYSSIDSILLEYQEGEVRSPFSCAPLSASGG